MAQDERKLRIAICGTRGIPACYGGFETFAEEVSTRLVERGHNVLVYGRSHVITWRKPLYRGVRLKLLPAPQNKYLETPIHSLLSLLHLAIYERDIDVILVCNAANSPFLWIPKILKQTVLVNVDGIERMRAKWNSLGKLWYRLGERCSVLFADKIIADADVIHSYYKQEYSADSVVIPYGYCESDDNLVTQKIETASAVSQSSAHMEELFDELGIRPNRYMLYVSRLEPENNAHLVIEAYNRICSQLDSDEIIPLVIVGDAPYAHRYIESLHAMAGAGVRFAGYRFGQAYRDLQLGAYCFIQATEVGGTHPALVEAMGFANCIIANGTPENREVIGDAGLVYEKNNTEQLADLMLWAINNPTDVQAFRKSARVRALESYSWDRVVDLYEDLFRGLVA